MSVLSVGLALILTVRLEVLGDHSPFTLFFAAVMVSTWYGGKKPGLVAIALSALVSDIFLLPPIYAVLSERAEILEVGTFILVASFINWLTTARQRSVKTLGESEDRYRVIAETASDGIITINGTSNILFVNQAAEKMFGYPSEELLGQSLTMLLPDYLRHIHQAGIGRYLTTGQRPLNWSSIELPGLHKSGQAIPLELSFGEFTKDGQHHFTGIIRDITKRKQSEEALREAVAKSERNRAELESVIQAVTEGIVVSDMAGNFVIVNEAEARIYGYSSSAEMKQDIAYFAEVYELSCPDGNPVPVQNWPLSKALRGESFANRELRGRRKDTGQEWFLSFSGEPVRNDRGEQILAVIVTRDISQRKLAEKERMLLAAIVESSDDAIISKTLEGQVTSWNQGAERIYGYTAVEAIGRPISLIVPPEQEDELAGILEHLSRGEAIEYLETVRLRKDGSRVDVSISISPLKDTDGRIVGASTIAHNITERKKLEDQFRQSQKLEAVGQLAGGVAHDFNNLLTVIVGYSDLMLRRFSQDDPLRRSTGEIRKAAERATSLTRQLLAFSRKQTLQPKVFELNSLVTETGKMLRRLVGEDIEFIIIVRPEAGCINADSGQIEQVLMNLVVNARDAMQQGGKLVIETANVKLDRAYADLHLEVEPGDYVMFSVSDTGTGIDKETRKHIFEPFFTTKGVDKGTGLGLSTVYGIVKQSGGNIWVYSEVGKGTTFKIYLPLVKEEAEAKQPAKSESPRGSDTILLVEDEAMVRALARTILAEKGYQVLEAANGNDAISICEQHGGEIDLMVTDVVMPLMSGRELAVRLAPSRPLMRVLYMSGYTDDAIVHHGVLDQGTPFLEKPFTPDALARKVREVLDAAR